MADVEINVSGSMEVPPEGAIRQPMSFKRYPVILILFDIKTKLFSSP